MSEKARKGCEMCDGSGCPCMRWRDWQSMEYGCECGCPECGLKPEQAPVPAEPKKGPVT